MTRLVRSDSQTRGKAQSL